MNLPMMGVPLVVLVWQKGRVIAVHNGLDDARIPHSFRVNYTAAAAC